jgi:hypothetical protein
MRVELNKLYEPYPENDQGSHEAIKVKVPLNSG